MKNDTNPSLCSNESFAIRNNARNDNNTEAGPWLLGSLMENQHEHNSHKRLIMRKTQT